VGAADGEVAVVSSGVQAVSADRQSSPASHTGLAMVVVMTGVLITAVDTTIVVLALPTIERDLHVSLSSVVWVVIGYLLVITLLATQVGRLGDMFGRVRRVRARLAALRALLERDRHHRVPRVAGDRRRLRDRQ
jgi:choline-glycine betaine transporter